jgi:hypothetical protein
VRDFLSTFSTDIHSNKIARRHAAPQADLPKPNGLFDRSERP